MKANDKIHDYLKQRFEERSVKFDPATWDGGDVSIVYDIQGPLGGQWTIAIEGGQPCFKEGGRPNASLTIRTSDTHFLDMMSGKLNPKMALLTGKIKYSGDRQVMMKLRNLLG